MCRICQELEEHHYYGLNKEEVHLLLQIEVPAIINTAGQLAIQSDGHLVLKPHGHGDIHTLLYQVRLECFLLIIGGTSCSMETTWQKTYSFYARYQYSGDLWIPIFARCFCITTVRLFEFGNCSETRGEGRFDLPN